MLQVNWLRYLGSPLYYVQVVMFFLLATPFELTAGSGYSYFAKLICAVGLIVTSGAMASLRPNTTLFLSVFLALIFLIANSNNPNDRVLLAFATILITVILGNLRTEPWNARLCAILSGFLAVHAAALLVVFANFFLRGDIIDLHSMVFPGAARTEQYGSVARIAGLHVEPGTYAQWTMAALFFRALITRSLGTPFNFAIVLTVALTFSLWAAMAVIVFLIGVLIEFILTRSTTTRWRAFLAIGLAGAAIYLVGTGLPQQFSDDALGFFQLKLNNSESSLDKLLATAEFWRTLPNNLVIGSPVTPGFCPACLAPTDVGLWANLIYYFGLLPMLFLFAAMAGQLLKWGIAFAVLAALMLVWKASYFDPLLWLIIAFVLFGPPVNRVRFEKRAKVRRARPPAEPAVAL
jgi:hypothetical protein